MKNIKQTRSGRECSIPFRSQLRRSGKCCRPHLPSAPPAYPACLRFIIHSLLQAVLPPRQTHKEKSNPPHFCTGHLKVSIHTRNLESALIRARFAMPMHFDGTESPLHASKPAWSLCQQNHEKRKPPPEASIPVSLTTSPQCVQAVPFDIAGKCNETPCTPFLHPLLVARAMFTNRANGESRTRK